MKERSSGNLIEYNLYIFIAFIVANSVSFHFLPIIKHFQEAKKGRLEKFEIPAKIICLSEPWTPESGLVTAALKLKREIIRKAFQEELSKLYSSV